MIRARLQLAVKTDFEKSQIKLAPAIAGLIGPNDGEKIFPLNYTVLL